VKVKFPFRYISANLFGQVWRPYAKILIRKKDMPKIWLERIAVVDSGADFTIFPKKDAAIFGIDLKKETKLDRTFGIGGQEKIYLYKKLEIKIGNLKLKIPVGFLDRNDIPALLGRQNFLEIFKLIFENHKTLIEK
jgi:hypothetical protein